MDTPERIAKLEAQVESIKDDVGELKADVKDLHSRITTGNREIMDKIDSVSQSLETKMKQNQESATQQHQLIEQEVKKDINTLYDKLSSLEKWKWMVIGGAIVIGYILGNIDITKLFGN